MVERAEIDQMAGFMRALNSQTYSTPENGVTAPTPTVSTSTSDVEAMKRVLESFHRAANGAVEIMTQDAGSDRELREALDTERTDHGARLGIWEIKLREVGKRKFYDVAQVGSQIHIASDLLLYEAALGLVRILNNGGKINSKEAISLLRAEQDYAGALNDAVIYKHYLRKNPHDRRVQVFEARYGDATRRAVAARDSVYEMVRIL